MSLRGQAEFHCWKRGREVIIGLAKIWDPEPGRKLLLAHWPQVCLLLEIRLAKFWQEVLRSGKDRRSVETWQFASGIESNWEIPSWRLTKGKTFLLWSHSSTAPPAVHTKGRPLLWPKWSLFHSVLFQGHQEVSLVPVKSLPHIYLCLNSPRRMQNPSFHSGKWDWLKEQIPLEKQHSFSMLSCAFRVAVIPESKPKTAGEGERAQGTQFRAKGAAWRRQMVQEKNEAWRGVGEGIGFATVWLWGDCQCLGASYMHYYVIIIHTSQDGFRIQWANILRTQNNSRFKWSVNASCSSC